MVAPDTLQHWIIQHTPKEPTAEQRAAIEACIKGFDIMHKIGKVYEAIPFAGWEHIKSSRNCAEARWTSICEHYDFTNKAVLDLGGNYGYMAFRALAAGASRAVVIDTEKTEIAAGPLFAKAYGYDNIQFISAGAPAILPDIVEKFDCAFALSTLPYIRYRHGDGAMEETVRWLAQNVKEAVFIETQLAGDSVGPPYWADIPAAIEYLQKCGFLDCRVIGDGFPAGLGAKRSIVRASVWENPLEFKADARHTGITKNAKIYGGDGRRVVKWDKDSRPHKEFEMLRRLQGPWFPKAIEVGEKYLVMTDLGQREPMTDEAKVKASADSIVQELDRAGIRHGDIGEWNIIINGNTMHLVDFGTARYADDTGWQPRGGSNKGNMKKALEVLLGAK